MVSPARASKIAIVPWTIAMVSICSFAFLDANGAASEAVANKTPAIADVAGTWVGTLSHDGETRVIAFHLEPADAGTLLVKLSTPAAHISEFPIGKAVLEPGGLRLGKSFVLTYDNAAATLTATIPASLVPVYRMTATFHRQSLEPANRPLPTAPVAKPLWTFDAGAPLWADAAYDHGSVYIGADDGQLHAIEATTGTPRWSFRAGAAIRSRPVCHAGDVFFQADDGFLYRLRASDGQQRWRTRVNAKPIERLPLSDPRSRFDAAASGVTLAGGRLYLGTHDGRVLALDSASGAPVWEFRAGDSVLSTPVASGGRIYFGSFDGNVYAVDAVSGHPLWKHDTGAPVVSTPALFEGKLIVGSRSYDLLALDAATGTRVWSRYIWFSWVESSATVRDGVVYVGSSDAAKLFAFDARSGRPIWDLDVTGWAWGQPAVTDQRAFIGTAGSGQYLIEHHGGFVAVDRSTGKMAWRYPIPSPPDGAPHGFAASAAIGHGRVFVGSIDGKLYAFAQ